MRNRTEYVAFQVHVTRQGAAYTVPQSLAILGPVRAPARRLCKSGGGRMRRTMTLAGMAMLAAGGSAAFAQPADEGAAPVPVNITAVEVFRTQGANATNGFAPTVLTPAPGEDRLFVVQKSGLIWILEN